MSGSEFSTTSEAAPLLEGSTDLVTGGPAECEISSAHYFSDIAQTRLFCAAAAIVASIAGYAVMFPNY